ncbi:unnamed protein product [Effrenium voratum]|uniref:Uncharacterized protein n=1 Tax=Effrenium voratum TaxID=2562239 RepID=A0AA36ID73_9DINO|nr:unnamed protein product [Effrenium voratum]
MASGMILRDPEPCEVTPKRRAKRRKESLAFSSEKSLEGIYLAGATGVRNGEQECLRQLELDAKTLRFDSEPQLEALRRLVSLARAAAEANQEPLAEIIKAQKVEEIFRARLRKGEACEHSLAVQGLNSLVAFKGMFPWAEKFTRALQHFESLARKDGFEAVKGLLPFIHAQCDLRKEVQDCQKLIESDAPNHQTVAAKEKLKELEQGGSGLDLDFFLKNNLLGHLVDAARVRKGGLPARKEWINLFLVLRQSLDKSGASFPSWELLKEAAAVAEGVQLITSESCYTGRAQRRLRLKGDLTAQQLREMRERWRSMPQEQAQLFLHLGGPESFMFLVRVAASYCRLDLAEEVSGTWQLLAERFGGTIPWQPPNNESDESRESRLEALLESFKGAERKRKRNAQGLN